MTTARTALLLLLASPSWAADAAHERTFRALLRRAEETDRFDRLILRRAQERRLNPRLVKAIIAAESGFRLRALSPKGARGLMQLLPATAVEQGVAAAELWQPDPNLRAGTGYLSCLYREAWKTYGLQGVSFRDGPDWAQMAVVAAYHGGPSLLHRRAWPASTVRYVREVMLYYRSPATALRLRSLPDGEELARL